MIDMIVGVDIGGTKTVVALFTESGKLLESRRFETNHNYSIFLSDLANAAASLNTKKAKIGCAAIPGLLNRRRGIALTLGNLPWKDVYVRHDISTALEIERIFIENDSKLAGLAEARYIRDNYGRVFYLTLSTGIGGALLANGELVHEVIDMEIGKIPLPFEGKLQPWEEFASGRAFFDKYGKKAVDVTSKNIWKQYAKDVNLGLGVICSTFQVEAIIFGGGLGQYLNRFEEHVMPYLDKNLHPIIRRPQALLSTHFRSQSVIYGCYEYAKDKLT